MKLFAAMALRIVLPILAVWLSTCSCPNNDNVYFYPSKAIYDSIERVEFIDPTSFNSFEQLMDTLESLKWNFTYGKLHIQDHNNQYTVLVTTSIDFYKPPAIKNRDLICVSADSIFKSKSYPLSDLEKILAADLKNNGKIPDLSQSPKKLIISITTELNSLENVLKQVCRAYNNINANTEDELQLNIHLNRIIGITPPPPPLN